MTVELGKINTDLTLSDNYSEVLNRISRNIERMVETQTKASSRVNNDAERLKSSYDKIAASLDPVVARTQKYDRAVDILKKSLNAGSISQEDFNKKLALADQKYGDNQRTLRVLEAETKKLEKSYERLAYSLDPVLRKTDQYEENLDTLNRSLKANIISQDTFDKRLGQLNKTLDDSATRINRLGSNLTEVGSTITRLSLPLAAVGGFAFKTSIDFESSFAGVRKTVDATDEELNRLAQSIREMAAGPKPIPIDVNELNAVAESAGQLGIKSRDILSFTRTMADLGETTNLSAEDAAVATAQFQNIFGVAGKEVDRFGATLVALGNDGASTERQIIEMGLRIAGAGNQIGLSQGEVLAFANALSSLGIEAEMGGSAISKVMINMAVAVSQGGDDLHNFAAVAGTTSERFAKAFKEDAAGAVTSFITGLHDIKESGGDVLGVLEKMDITEVRMRDTLLRAAGAGDLLNRSLDLQSKAWQENNALTVEASKRYSTAESQLKITWQRFKDIGITLGDSLVPVMKSMLNVLEPLMKTLAYFAELFGRLPGPVKMVAVAIGGITLATGPMLFLLGQMMQMWGTFIQIAPTIAAKFAAIRLSILGLTGVIAGVLLGLNHIIDKWKEAMDASIQYSVEAGNLEGRALTFVRNTKEHGGKVTSTALQQATKDLADLEAKIKKADETVRSLRNTVKTTGTSVDPRTGASYQNSGRADSARQKLTEEQNNLNSLRGAYDRLKKSIGAAVVEKEKVVKATTPIVPALKGVKEEVDKTAKAWEDFSKAAMDAVLTTREELKNAASLLASRRIGTDAVRLQSAMIDALRKATAAGTAATSQQRLEIIRNTVSVFQLGNALEEIGERQRQTTDLFQKNREELEKEVIILEKLLALLGEISDTALRSSIDLNVSQVNSGGQEATDFTRDRINYANEWRESWRTSREIAQEEIDRINGSLLSATEKQRALSQIQLEGIETQLNNWSSFFSTLGGMFGGIAAKISGYLQTIQQGVQAGQQLGTAMGGGQWTAALGGAGAIVAIAAITYDWMKGNQADRRARNYDYGAVVGMNEPGQWNFPVLEEAQRRASQQIAATAEAFAATIGGTIETFANLEVTVRRDGKYFQSFVEGVLVGQFESMEGAISAGLLEVFTHAATNLRGISDLVREGLEYLGNFESEVDFQTLEEAQVFLTQLREISEIGLAQGTLRIRQTTQHLDQLWEALGKLPAGQERLQGTVNLITSEIDDWMSWRRSITGEQESRAEIAARQQREAQQFMAERDLRIAELRLDEIRLKNELRLLESRRQIAGGNAAIDNGEVQARFRYLQAKGVLLDAEVDLHNAEIEATRAMLEAIGSLIASLEAIPDIDLGRLKPPGQGGSGRSGGDIGQFISDRRWQLSLDAMGEYARQLAEIEQQYRDIGRPTAELIALRDREIAQLNRNRNREVAGNFQEFMGLVSPFDQIRKTAADLIADIKDSPFGDARKASMIGRVLGEVDRQIERMSQEMARGLFSEMLGDLEKFGADETLLLQLRQNMAVIEHTLKMAHYQEEIAILKAKGKLTAEQMKLLDDSFEVLKNINPLTIVGTGTTTGQQPLTPSGQELTDYIIQREAEEANKLAEALKRARESLNRYKDDGIDPLTKDLREIFRNFAEIKLYMGATPEVVNTFNRAVSNAVDRFLDPIRQSQRDLFFGQESAVDTMTQWTQLQSERDSLMSRFRAGDLSVVDEIANFGSELMDLAGDVIPMGSRAYKRIQDDWDSFLTEVQMSVPGMADIDNAPMNIVGMDDLTAIGEAQVDRLDALNTSQNKTNEYLASLNQKVGYTGGLDSVN